MNDRTTEITSWQASESARIAEPRTALRGACTVFGLIAILSLIWPGAGHAQREGHGGHPIIITAPVFPNRDSLDGATERILKKLESSALPKEFLASLADELRSLRANDRFRVVPAILVPFGASPAVRPELDGVKPHPDQFISYAGLTNPFPGASIFLAEWVVKHSADELAPIVLHEVLHHVAPRALRGNEEFINDLREAMWAGTSSPILEFAVLNGVYFKRGRMNRDEFLAFLDFKSISELYISKIKDPTELRLRFAQRLPADLGNMPLADFAEILTEIASRQPATGVGRDVINTPYIVETLTKFIARNYPKSPWVDLLAKQSSIQWGCRRLYSQWFGATCKRSEGLLMKEVFIPSSDPFSDAALSEKP